VIRVGFVQFSPKRQDVQSNIQQLENLLDGVKADLLVLPELSNTGYLYAKTSTLEPHAEPGDGSGLFLSAMRSIASRVGGLLIVGFAENSNQGLYNSAVALNGDGMIQIYRKIHLFSGEKSLFLPGERGLNIFTFRGIKIGMMICFDWIFPEAARTLALKGAQIIVHPSNLVLPHCQSAMRTRSLENGVFSITANRHGSESLGRTTLKFTGRSQIIDPRGNCLADAPEDGDTVQLVDIEPNDALNKLITSRNDLFSDRQPKMYSHE
jgi:predicted amidohydrolase